MGIGSGDSWFVSRGPAHARGPLSAGAPTTVPSPSASPIYFDTNGDPRTYVNPLGVYAVELDRRARCGPVRVNNDKVLFPGEIFVLGRADAPDLRIETAYSRMPTGNAARTPPTGNAGKLDPFAPVILHRHPDTMPQTASRSHEATAKSIAPFPLLAAGTDREIVQIVADGFSCATVTAWARTAPGVVYSAFVELVWCPRDDNVERVEAQPVVVVPVGDTVGVAVYNGPTKGCSIIRLVGQIPANNTIAVGEIRIYD